MTYGGREQNLIVLDSLEGFTYNLKRTLLRGFKSGDPDFAGGGDIIKPEFAETYKKGVKLFNDQNYRAGVLLGLEQRGVKAVTYFSPDYPRQLKKIPSPPMVLYCKGDVRLLWRRFFAIVGSRHTPLAYAKAAAGAAEQIAKKFAVVTGIADGGDAAAVKGALKGGKIICVLAYGFDHMYPAVNEQLLKEVEKNGLVITEHRPEVEPRSYLFPARNRIIAALAEGVLVVSAGIKSGALITADYAKTYGKDVFAFPHGLGSAYGAGCNKLIKEGATLVESSDDVLKHYGMEIEKQAPFVLSEGERAVLAAICELGEAHVEQIAEKVGKKPFMLAGELTSLELKQAIARLGGNRYCALRGIDET